MTDNRGFVIIGGGLAGAKAAEALRKRGYEGAIRLYAAEPHLPYERPPLSKGYLKSGRASRRRSSTTSSGTTTTAWSCTWAPA